MNPNEQTIKIIGGGLAGCEAAWQAAERGARVALYEMRPLVQTGAHTGENLAELVCSNSLGATQPDRASGLLKEELRLCGSFLLSCAEQTSLPAGTALAVDREAFSALVTSSILAHPRIELIREEAVNIPESPVIISTGPLTSPGMSTAICDMTGKDNLFFYDALAPIVTLESIDMNIAFRASRHNTGAQTDGDYINCPMTKSQYDAFVTAILSGQHVKLRDFEQDVTNGVQAGKPKFFEGCLPVEEIARRGHTTLAFGTLRPIGITDPRNGYHPYAVVQLRQDNLAGSLYNLVGFQTNLTYAEQQRIFRMIPGLENAEFVRYGQMHRNTYISSPQLLDATFQFIGRPGLFFAGQITGFEGYMGNIASGLLAGINAYRSINQLPLITFPETTMIGSLCNYITRTPVDYFQPMKANFGVLPPLEDNVKSKRQRAQEYSNRALTDMRSYINLNQAIFDFAGKNAVDAE